MSIEYRVGDVFDRLAEIPDGSIDLIVTSPPFLALRSYLPADHPDKAKEIGSEPTPAEFLDTLLALTAEWGRVLAPHGSLCVELGDTYSGSGGAGGDYTNHDGLRAGQQAFKGSASKGNGWPLPKSMSLVPHLYTASLAYGRNILTGAESPAGMWRIRNVICWARPNPPVGALGDKFRPATSYITVACKSAKRYFDLDAVRTEHKTDDAVSRPRAVYKRDHDSDGVSTNTGGNPAGAPPLDWHADDHPEDGDWLWKLPTQPYSGAHFAAFPLKLPKRLIEAMCPQRVCTECGKPSERITGDAEYVSNGKVVEPHVWASGMGDSGAHTNKRDGNTSRAAPTLGWTDCDCPDEGDTMADPAYSKWRTGVVLDPFGGSGTTGAAALAVGRDAIMIDLDERNADLAVERCGMFLEVDA